MQLSWSEVQIYENMIVVRVGVSEVLDQMGAKVFETSQRSRDTKFSERFNFRRNPKTEG